jgi:glutamine amidotransferase
MLARIMMVDIVNVGCGNIASIKNWIEFTSCSARVVDDPRKLKSSLMVLPGVGAVGSFMDRLKTTGFNQAILDHSNAGGRLLGICLGFQVMAVSSEESGGVECLGLINGKVEKLRTENSHSSWEKFYVDKKYMDGQSFNSEASLSRKRIVNGRVFYNHGYGFVNQDGNSFSVPISRELSQYSALVVKNNLIGFQFHPEKSQLAGQNLISIIL